MISTPPDISGWQGRLKITSRRLKINESKNQRKKRFRFDECFTRTISAECQSYPLHTFHRGIFCRNSFRKTKICRWREVKKWVARVRSKRYQRRIYSIFIFAPRQCLWRLPCLETISIVLEPRIKISLAPPMIAHLPGKKPTQRSLACILRQTTHSFLRGALTRKSMEDHHIPFQDAILQYPGSLFE